MNKILYAIISLALFTSCAKSYNILGTSNVSSLDGRKLYLKASHADSLLNLDSCDVVHGEFVFHGSVDSAKIVQVFMDDINLQFPIVLEQGDIVLKLDNTQQSVSGTPLNDKLNTFWKKFTQLRNQYAEIDHEESAAILNGQDEEQYRHDSEMLKDIKRNPNAMAKIARQRYFMKADDEDIFVLSDDEETVGNSNQNEATE